MIERLHTLLTLHVRRFAERLSAPFADNPPLLCGCAGEGDPACCVEA